MSVRFDRTNLSNAGDWLKADNANLAPTNDPFAFSVSLWVYFHVATATDPETIWYFGEIGTSDKFLVLEAFPDPITDETRVRVRMKQGASELSGSDSGVLSLDEWHLITVVATKNDDLDVVLTLWVDAQSTVIDSAALGTTTVDDYDRFALGRHPQAAEGTDACSFHAEQVAIWDVALAEIGDHDAMWSNKTPPEELSNAPGLAYWVLAGHHRNGLRTHNTQIGLSAGDLLNEAGGSQPHMQLSDNDNPGPLWSVKTPALLYETTGTLGTVPSRKPKVAASRINPNFHFFARPELYGDWGQVTPIDKRGTNPIWDHPNMNVMARVFYTNVRADKYAPPNYVSLSGYDFDAYLTQVAKRLADWFEYQGFTNETGSEGNGQYEGSLFISGLGGQNVTTGTLGRNKQDLGSGQGMPLEQHPLDEVTPASDPAYSWATWFRASGESLVKEYCEELWPLVKAEFDRRGLAYPKRLHWDYEDSPSAGRVLPDGLYNENFTAQLADSRSTTSTGEVLADSKTLDDMWAEAPSAVTNYTPSLKATHADNQAWHRWYDSWKTANRSQALDTAIMTPALSAFSKMQWSNYKDYIADDPDYLFPDTRTFTIYNTQAVQPKGDFSSPVLYTSLFQHTFVPTYGASYRSSYRWMIRARIDACVNASDPLPLSPWFPGVGYQVFKSNPTALLVEVSREDLRHMLWYAWQRGCDEYIMWLSIAGGSGDDWTEGSDESSQEADIDATYEECKNFVNTVKCMMNTKGSRTCRMGRTYRHCR
jgi:hypothetical protein